MIAGDHMVSIQSLILKLTDDSKLKWLGMQCSLHIFQSGAPWALLSKERSDSLPVGSLVGSGQTLLLLVDSASENK